MQPDDNAAEHSAIKILLARLETKLDTVLDRQQTADKRAIELECRVRGLENHRSKITGAVSVIGAALAALFTYILRKF